MRFRKYHDRLSASTSNHSVPRQWLGRAANTTSKQDTQYIYFLLLEQGTRAGRAAMGEWGKGQRGGAVPEVGAESLPNSCHRHSTEAYTETRMPECVGLRA